MNTVYVKAVGIKVLPPLFDFCRLAVLRLICMIGLHTDNGEDIVIIVFVHKRKLFTANSRMVDYRKLP